MQKKTGLKTTALITLLLISIAVSCMQQNCTSTSNSEWANSSDPSTLLDYDTFQLIKHEMSQTELTEYKTGMGVYQEGKNYNQILGGFGTGLSPPTLSEWADIAENAYVVDQVTYGDTLPATVDLTETAWFPPIGNQGYQGSCASFAIGYYCKTYQEAKEHQWDLTQAQWTGGATGEVSASYQNHVMSPAFLYNLINQGTDRGSNFETAIKLVCNVGISTWETMPYDCFDYEQWPTTTAWAEAPLYRSNSEYSYQYLYANSDQGIENLKNWLAAGNLAVMAIDSKGNLDYLRVKSATDMITTDIFVDGQLNHAATIVGYDDNILYIENGELTRGAFKIANSWGEGLWENVIDGCYWISYQTMKQLVDTQNPIILFTDMEDYQPQILASFNITHNISSELEITFGLGTPDKSIVTKKFTDFVERGNRAFPQNNIIFDISEFKEYMTCLYDQTFFMQVYDTQTGTTGTINLFSVGDVSSPQAPTPTINNVKVNLMLTCSIADTTFRVIEENGAPFEQISLRGEGFTGTSVDLFYLNPLSPSQWIPIVTNYALDSINFTYITNAPDLLQCNPQGDNPPSYNSILFRAQDNGDSKSYNSSNTYNEWNRGILQVSDLTATGLFGNNTDLTTSAFVQKEQTLVFAGEGFKPGTAVMFWDNTQFGQASINETGSFNTILTAPTTAAGKHVLMVDDGAATVSVNITRLPAIANNYTDLWRTNDFSITLTADFEGISETYYKINNGQILSVSTDGQPVISSEGGSNTLEYWAVWDVYGSGSMELAHTTLSAIKLDKTAPQASMKINEGSTVTTVTSVVLTFIASDDASGVNLMRISNNATWTQAVWEPFSSIKNWQLTSDEGTKTVSCQIQDYAGFVTTVSANITLSTETSGGGGGGGGGGSAPTLKTPKPTVTPTITSTPSPMDTTSTSPDSTPTIPEYNFLITIILLAIATLSLIATTKIKNKKRV